MIRLKKIWDINPQGREEPHTNSVLHPGRPLCLDSAAHSLYWTLQSSVVSVSIITFPWGPFSSLSAFVPTRVLCLNVLYSLRAQVLQLLPQGSAVNPFRVPNHRA